MRRTARLFLSAFVVALGSVGMGEFLHGRHNSDAQLWFQYGSTVSAYMVLAVGYLLDRDSEHARHWPWVAVVSF